jgi:hypothetical protein
MSDSYLTIAEVAGNTAMYQRMQACVIQQAHLGNVPLIEDPTTWVGVNSYLWASSPGWGEKWDYANATHPPEPVEGQPLTVVYDPGRDAAVITDADILATVQTLGSSA